MRTPIRQNGLILLDLTMEPNAITSANFVQQILQTTVAKQMQTDKERMQAIVQIKAQQVTVDQKTQVAESLLDVYA